MARFFGTEENDAKKIHGEITVQRMESESRVLPNAQYSSKKRHAVFKNKRKSRLNFGSLP